MTPRHLLVPLVAALALVLAACGGSDPAPTTTAATTGPEPAVAPTTTPVAPTPAPEPGGAAPTGDRAAIRALHADFVAAYLALDGDRACGYLSQEARTTLEADPRYASFGGTCAERLTAASNFLQGFLDGETAYELRDLTVTGDHAEAGFLFPAVTDRPEVVTFDRIGGEWRIGPEGARAPPRAEPAVTP